MAHATVEWTDNLEIDGFRIRPLLQLIAASMRDADGVFPWAGIRVRGIRLTDYVIADDSGQDAFINIAVLMGAGRSAEFKQAFFGQLFDQIHEHLAPVFESRYLALSLYVNEPDGGCSYKSNNIHTRFKKSN